MTKPDKRDEIVRAALELIAEHGFHGAPMAMIAERAGVGAGTIYRYFENKDVLINELYREIEEKIVSAHSGRVLAGKTIQGAFSPSRHDTVAPLHRACPLNFRYLEQFHNSPYGVAFRRDNMLEKSAWLQCFQGAVRTGDWHSRY